jgi:predicted GH43/DUF377 family glycosyl hydrolase
MADALTHAIARDPGTDWSKDSVAAINVPPDEIVDPLPEARWSVEDARTGIYGVVTPNVVALSDGSYRMYYTQIFPREGFPAGANDYDNSTTRILSAVSADGIVWAAESGVRLSAEQGGAGDFRVVSPEVVPLVDNSGRWRMYFECCAGPQSVSSTLRSALSEDGLTWVMEPGVRMGEGGSYNSPRLTFLADGRCRLYCGDRGSGIVSALSEDGGLTFVLEPGLRIAQESPYEALTVFAPEVLTIAGGGYRMYYAGYSAANRAYVLGAVSEDGLHWQKEDEPVIAPGGRWDGAKCSEMCVVEVPGEEGLDYRLFYEACDGVAIDERGVWRIAGATAAR